MLNIFTDNCTPTLCDGDRVLHILTGYPCDNLLVVVDGDMSDEEIEGEVGFALLRKFGRSRPAYRGYEDVTDVYQEVQ